MKEAFLNTSSESIHIIPRGRGRGVRGCRGQKQWPNGLGRGSRGRGRGLDVDIMPIVGISGPSTSSLELSEQSMILQSLFNNQGST
jgi:hypothetical protein